MACRQLHATLLEELLHNMSHAQTVPPAAVYASTSYTHLIVWRAPVQEQLQGLPRF
jgi:hypothetical protein